MDLSFATHSGTVRRLGRLIEEIDICRSKGEEILRKIERLEDLILLKRLFAGAIRQIMEKRLENYEERRKKLEAIIDGSA